jgi:hypothetical protein
MDLVITIGLLWLGIEALKGLARRGFFHAPKAVLVSRFFTSAGVSILSFLLACRAAMSTHLWVCKPLVVVSCYTAMMTITLLKFLERSHK